jgi:hypothetical protein
MTVIMMWTLAGLLVGLPIGGEVGQRIVLREMKAYAKPDTQERRPRG